MPKSHSTSKKVAAAAAKSAAASALTHVNASGGTSEVETLRARVAELEEIVRGKTSMLDYLAGQAGYQPGDTFNGRQLVERLRGKSH